MGYLEEVLCQLCKLSGCGPKKRMAIIKRALDLWKVRTTFEWAIEVGPQLLAKYPILSNLPNFDPAADRA